MSRGVHRVTITDPDGTATDLSCDTTAATIRHGRDNADGQPEASTASLDVYGPIPAGLDIGWGVSVDAGLDEPGAFVRRFTGTVTDLGLDYDLGLTPGSGRLSVRPYTSVTVASALAALGRTYVGDVPWPAELDGPRVARILTLAGRDDATTDPGTVAILARDVDRQPALSLCQQVADDAGGLLTNRHDGVIAYHDAEHRRNLTPALTIDACHLLMSPKWLRDMSGLLNEAAIGYGDPPEGGGDQAVVTRISDASQARYGRVAYYSGTQLADAAAATVRADTLIARNALPVWNLSELPVDTVGLPAADLAALLSLDVGGLLGLTGLPLDTPDEPVMAVWVEGWTETLGYLAHDLTLAVTAYCRTAPFPRWNDLPSTYEWDEMGDLTWDGAACIGPPITEGRWDDTPATLYYDTTPPDVTWDAWPY